MNHIFVTKVSPDHKFNISVSKLQVFGYSLFVIGYWISVIGYWLLDIGYWLFQQCHFAVVKQ